jgi:ATP-dependent protease Clp ATPase subunit
MFKFESDVDLEFTDAALREIARRAKEKKIGARGLRSVLEEVLDEVGFEYPSIENLAKVIIKDDLSYEYVLGVPKEEKQEVEQKQEQEDDLDAE